MIGPATEAGLLLEPSLVETVLADLGDEPGSLPLVCHALFATWQRRRGRVLAVAGYQQAGGVRQTIAHSPERVFGALSPTPQGIAKDVFLRLTALGDGTQDTRAGACGGLSWWPAEAPRPSRWSLSGWLRRAW